MLCNERYHREQNVRVEQAVLYYGELHLIMNNNMENRLKELGEVCNLRPEEHLMNTPSGTVAMFTLGGTAALLT